MSCSADSAEGILNLPKPCSHPRMRTERVVSLCISEADAKTDWLVAGARAPATGGTRYGCAQPVQALPLSIANWALKVHKVC